MVNYIFSCIKTSIFEQLQYKTSLLIAVISVVIDLFCSLIVFILMFNNFSNLKGWEFFEITLLYSLYLSCHGLSMIFTQNMWGFPYKVMSGDFDYMCTKPRPILVQLIFSSFSITALFYCIGGIIGVFISLNELINITFSIGIMLLFFIISGAMIEIAITTLIISLSFKYFNVNGAIELNTDLMNEVLGYPLDIYNETIRFIFTFLYPIGFINYYPIVFILHKGGIYLILLEVFLVLVLLCFSIFVFNRSRKKYQGIGG